MTDPFLRYGLLVDPPQWFYTLNGGPFRFGDRYPSLMVLICKWFGAVRDRDPRARPGYSQSSACWPPYIEE